MAQRATLPIETMFNLDTIKFVVKRALIDLEHLRASSQYVIKDGEIRFDMTNRLRIPGLDKRHKLQMRYDKLRHELHIEGALYAFLYGQNVYTTANIKDLCIAVLRAIKDDIGLKPRSSFDGREWVRGDIELRRVDIAVNFMLDSEEQVIHYLKQLALQCLNFRGSMRKVETTVYWTPRLGKHYSICNYAKGAQLRSKKLNDNSKASKIYDRLIDHCEPMLRIEVKVMRTELKENDVELAGSWNVDTARNLFERYFKNMKVFNVLNKTSQPKSFANLTRQQKIVVELLHAGVDLEQLYAKSTLKQYRAEFRKHNVDIRTPVSKEKAIQLLDILQSKTRIAKPPNWLKHQEVPPAVKIKKFTKEK